MDLSIIPVDAIRLRVDNELRPLVALAAGPPTDDEAHLTFAPRWVSPAQRGRKRRLEADGIVYGVKGGPGPGGIRLSNDKTGALFEDVYLAGGDVALRWAGRQPASLVWCVPAKSRSGKLSIGTAPETRVKWR